VENWSEGRKRREGGWEEGMVSVNETFIRLRKESYVACVHDAVIFEKSCPF
jgi:hypothetical protein